MLCLVSAAAAQEHRFFDPPARFEIAKSASIFAADGFNTCNDRAHEDWLPTQSCRGAALWMGMNFCEEVGTAYFLHRVRHHRLERIAEFVAPLGSAAGLFLTIRSASARAVPHK